MRIELYSANYLNFVELNITGDNDDYRRCDLESKYLDSSVFFLFQHCFESANPTFDYFTGNKYNARKIIVLRNYLIENLSILNKITDADDLKALLEVRYMGPEFLTELEAGDNHWNDVWKHIQEKLVNVNKDLIDLAEKCAFDERVLWVVGY